MNKPSILAVALCLLAASSSVAWANPQHERMKRCNQEAREKSLKGDERKQFMSGCLSGKHEGQGDVANKGAKPEAAAKTTKKTQPAAPAEKANGTNGAKPAVVPVAASKEAVVDPKERMKACNRQATEKTLAGDERKRFVSECLKG
ncbi:PsiF repeat-containing protein [Azoarcus indigens]|uniref:PsiF repeat-containing protein n=1 Tax=Azoarcus indigens TaxID=29545 RepID=A0A4R6DQS0_9RHOO|nr:PsiF family protein [Azoarcus indigens]NMG66461.1 PsiF repeat-containing protein [Azoarcus indigens]TDN47370.1 psiF repeat-containing protein [Azoarcus indigens]